MAEQQPDPSRRPPLVRGWIRCTDEDQLAVWVPVHNIACIRASGGGACIALVAISESSDEDADLYVSQNPDEVARRIAQSQAQPHLSAVAA